MDFSENYDELLVLNNVDLDKKFLRNNISRKSSLLPFKVSLDRADFDNGFYNIFGEFSRILLDKTLNVDLDINDLINHIINEDIEVEDGTNDFLIKLLKEYIFNEKNELNLLDPYLYLYVPLSSNRHSIGEKEVALFLRDIFCINNEELINFFKSNDSNHVIINLILNNAPYLENHKTEPKYYPILTDIVELFNDDVNFAIKHEKFFLDNMENIFAYYYYFYITQLILKISKRFNDDGDISELFYLLDWENVSKNRKTLNNGYNFLKKEVFYTLPKVNLISQLNVLLGTEYLLEKDLYEYYSNLNNDDQQNFIYYLKKWISNYRYIRNFDDIVLPDDFKRLVDILLDSINDKNNGIDEATKRKYRLNLEEIAKKYFLKRRGSYGYVLNMNRDMLLVITSLCVKDKKIKLNQLFKEYEKRGIFFDKYSKEEVVNFLTKLNLIDKKSDSGDAQYVKPVL